ncbi:hypothetical protein OPQ81_001254 [Rhizoctonia solani]|nr:hypothetical protein OPQ81_001254 [Rhizoctonia solani]
MIEFSDGWLTQFKHHYGIKECIFHGEAASAPIELIKPAQKDLQEAISQYPLDAVINMDETALLSSQGASCGLASQPLSGQKVDKTHLTVALATTAGGGKLPPLIIDHAQQLHAFPHGTPADYQFWYERED